MSWTAPRTWVTGEIVTAAEGNQQWRDNMIEMWHIADETAFTDKSVPSSTTIVTGASIAFDGVQQVRVEFWSPILQMAATAGAGLVLTLSEDSTSLGTLIEVVSTSGGDWQGGFACSAVRTPAAGSHAYKIVGTQFAGTHTVKAGYLRTWVKG